MKRIVLLLAILICGCAATLPAPTDEARNQLAPGGILRVAVLTSNPIIGTKDAKGELGGTTVLLGRELAASAGVGVRFIDYTAVNRLVEDAAKGAWDVAVVAIDPARRNVLDFSPPHLAADGFLTVLVPPGSEERRVGKRV